MSSSFALLQTRRLLLLGLASLFAVSSVSAENLIQDGAFDLPIRGSSDVYQTGRSFGAWKVDHKQVRLLKQGEKYLKDSTHAGNAVELAAWWRPGAIHQVIPTTPGANYTLTFAYAGNFRTDTYAKGLEVVIPEAGVLESYAVPSKPAGWSTRNVDWQEATVEFTASTDEVTLKFVAVQEWWHNEAMIITNVEVAEAAAEEEEEEDPFAEAPKALDTVKVPLPDDLEKFVKDREKAAVLGKALFWDMQVGSDGFTACATCHFASGVDFRTVNVVHPGAPGSAFGPQREGQAELFAEALAAFEGANEAFEAEEFPHAKTEHPTRDISDNPLVEDSKEVYGSPGVVSKDFVQVIEGSPVDEGVLVADPIFNINGANARQVTGRNTPTTINAVFFDRLFWDGRANHFFNGVNEFGDLDPNATVLKHEQRTETKTEWKWVEKTQKWRWWTWSYWSYEPVTTTVSVDQLSPTHICLNNAALASQAVGPPLSSVEMSWHGRNFKEIGRKMLSLHPLAFQKVHADDSVLGPYANASGPGLQGGVDYASLIREAFADEWWSSEESTNEGYTQMESNFSLFWGLSLMMYQSQLVSDQSPYDKWANGDEHALSDAAKRGLKIFLNEGKCINCHGGSEFAGATISDIRTPGGDEDSEGLSLIEFMEMGNGEEAYYDGGFYNIGVRPTLEDLGVGADHPEFGPLSYSRQRANGRDVGQDINVDGRIAVDGAFKTPSIRNVELTGPFFHTGGYRTLREVVEFYTRGGTFIHQNSKDADPDVDGISELQEEPERIDDVVEFMKHLTDDRVRFQKAPFDHPELFVPNGHTGVQDGVALDNIVRIPEVGRNGGEELKSFEDRVQ